MALFGSFQNAHLVHFLCTTGIVLGIVLFMIIHVSLALLVSRPLVAMFTGPILDRYQPASGTT